MTFVATLPAAILETILTHLATLFLTGANNDPQAARRAAAAMLASYHPRNEDELSLASNIIMFSFQALDALSQAAQPDTPISRVIRLRSGAVSLSREAAKAQRRLAQLRDPAQQPVEALRAQPQPEPEPKPAAPAQPKHLTWTQAHEQRQRDLRIAASLKRAEAKAAALPPPPQASDQTPVHQRKRRTGCLMVLENRLHGRPDRYLLLRIT